LQSYLLLYIVLVGLLAGFRYFTRDTNTQLANAQQQLSEQKIQRDAIRAQVQTLEAAARVRSWALQQGMQPYTRAKTEFLPAGATTSNTSSNTGSNTNSNTGSNTNSAPKSTVEVQLQWR
jgi:cell division protein FtsL